MVHLTNFYVTNGDTIGFGETNELAEEDLYINACRKDIANDTKQVFVSRREELMPWRPKANMLHLNGCGCLVYENNRLTNTKTDKSITIRSSKDNIFYYIAELFGNSLSYEDIVIVLQKDFDDFFRAVIPGVRLIRDMPIIRVADSSLGFRPECTYTFGTGVIIGIASDMVGVKRMGDDMFYILDQSDYSSTITDCAYICYKLGVLFTKEGVSLIGETN